MLQTVAGTLIEALEKTGVTHTWAALAAAGKQGSPVGSASRAERPGRWRLGLCSRAPWRLTPTIASTCPP